MFIYANAISHFTRILSYLYVNGVSENNSSAGRFPSNSTVRFLNSNGIFLSGRIDDMNGCSISS